jgi:hypothetical protein
MRKIQLVLGFAIILFGAAIASMTGCTYQSTTPDPSTEPMADPMNYKPNFDDTDISGGDTANFDSKAFKRDVNHVFNP